MNTYEMCNFSNLYKKISSINIRYKNGELDSNLDEAGANGYWDLAKEFAGENDKAQDVFYEIFVAYFLRSEISEDEFLKIYSEAVKEKLKDAFNKGSNAITVSEEKLTTEVWQLVKEDGFFKGAVQCDLVTIDLSIEESDILKKITKWENVPAGMKDRIAKALNPKII